MIKKKKKEIWPIMKRLIEALALLKAVEIFPFASMRLTFSPALQV